MDAAPDAMQPATHAAADGSAKAEKAPSESEPPPLERALGRLWDEMRALVNDQLLLASLEARRSVSTMVRIVILGLVCAALLLGAWAVAMMAVLMWLLDSGMSSAAALMIVMGSTFLLAAAMLWLTRRSLDQVGFPATLRRLASAPLPKTPQ